MGYETLDTLSPPWAATPSGTWAMTNGSIINHLGEPAVGMLIQAPSVGPPAPAAERALVAPVDLRPFDELRFWFRSTRGADGTPAQPYYLSFEADAAPLALPPWRRLLRIERANTWGQQRLWVGDMPAPLRQAVTRLRFRSLDPGVAFEAVVAEMLAVRSTPISNAEAALLERLDNSYSATPGGPAVRAVLKAVDAPPAAEPQPFLLVTPWSATPRGTPDSRSEVVDNPTPVGFHVRPAPAQVVLEYRLTAVAPQRAQSAAILDGVLGDFVRRPYLIVAGEAVAVTPFRPAAEEQAVWFEPGRTGLYYRFTVSVESGDRQFRPRAVPTLLTGQPAESEPAERVSV